MDVSRLLPRTLDERSIIAVAAVIGAATSKIQAETPAPQKMNGQSHSGTLRTITIWAALWAAPVLLVLALDHTFLINIALFFSKLAVVTFGGAYAVLAYMTQTVSFEFGWISADEMIDALGLAETTPGPLILVTEFVGLLAGYKEAGVGLMLAAGALTLWCTFVPCFLWIFGAAPYVEILLSQPRLKGALEAITAAVVGVILNLSLWFALHVLFSETSQSPFGLLPIPQSFDVTAFILLLLAAAMLLWRNINLPLTLATCTLCGVILSHI